MTTLQKSPKSPESGISIGTSMPQSQECQTSSLLTCIVKHITKKWFLYRYIRYSGKEMEKKDFKVIA